MWISAVQQPTTSFTVAYSICAIVCVLMVLLTCRRVSQDTPDDVGTIDADPAPSTLSKSQRRRLRKKAARATPPSYPSPQAMEAAEVRLLGQVSGLANLRVDICVHAKLSVSQILHNVTVLFTLAYTMLLPGGCRARCHVAFATAVFCQCILQAERSFVLHGLLQGRKLAFLHVKPPLVQHSFYLSHVLLRQITVSLKKLCTA